MHTEEAPATREQQRYYDARWTDEPERPNRLELLRLLEILRSLYDTGINFAREPIRICDLGCGRGWLSHHLSQLGEVTGVDFSAEAVRKAQTKWPHIRFEQGDVTSYRSSSLFDVVVSSEVLEHVQDKAAFFATAQALLKPGGHLILTTPNHKLHDRYARSESEQQPIEEWISVRDLRDLAGTGFRVLRHETFLFDVFYSGVFRVLSAPKVVRICTTLRVEWLRRWVHSRGHLGLHQVLHAKART